MSRLEGTGRRRMGPGGAAAERAARRPSPAHGGFLHDDRGSATVWNLIWLIGLGALLGLGIDTTAAMNTKARLQSVADAASHAAVMDLFPVSSTATGTALRYARANVPMHDGVVTESDVALGYWDAGAPGFRTGDVPFLNAVRVVAGRDAGRENALSTTFLRLVGFREWGIDAVATSIYFGNLEMVDRCRKNGLFAAGRVLLAANNVITGDYCVHGERGFKITQNNYVTCGVELSTPTASGWLTQSVTPPAGNAPACNTNYGALSNQQMIEQVFLYRSIPNRAEAEYAKVREMIEAFIDGKLDNDPFNAIAPYLTHAEAISPAVFDELAAAGALAPGTLYLVSCGQGGSIRPQGLVRNVGIYTDCVIDVRSGGSGALSGTGGNGGTTEVGMDPAGSPVTPALTCESALAAGYASYATYLDTAGDRTYRDNETIDLTAEDCGIGPGASGVWDNVFVFTTAQEGGNRAQPAVILPQGIQLGRMDACREGGGVRIYAAGSLSAPAKASVHGSHFIVLGDVHMAGQLEATYGMTIEATGDIQMAAQANLGGCPPDERDLATDVVLTVRPVAIVD